jgi:uncharacterized protein (DUF697 family)
MGAGLIPVPLVDLVVVSGVQLKMLADISKVYGVKFHENRGKALIAALLGYVLPNSLSFGTVGSLIKAIPVIGQLAGAPSMVAFCGASTYAVGKVFIHHFESGGTFLSFDPAKVREHFQQEFAAGGKIAEEFQASQSEKASA